MTDWAIRMLSPSCRQNLTVYVKASMWLGNVVVIQVLKHPSIQLTHILVPLAEYINNLQTQARFSFLGQSETVSHTAAIQAKILNWGAKHVVWLPEESLVSDIPHQCSRLGCCLDWPPILFLAARNEGQAAGYPKLSPALLWGWCDLAVKAQPKKAMASVLHIQLPPLAAKRSLAQVWVHTWGPSSSHL